MVRKIHAAAVICGCLMISGCASVLPDFSRSLPGISLKQGAADPYLQDLSRRAQRFRDKQAMLELGTRYEYGNGVPVNWDLAETFYKAASINEGGSTWSMGAGGSLSFIPGATRKGLPEARARLQALRAKRKSLGR